MSSYTRTPINIKESKFASLNAMNLDILRKKCKSRHFEIKNQASLKAKNKCQKP